MPRNPKTRNLKKITLIPFIYLQYISLTVNTTFTTSAKIFSHYNGRLKFVICYVLVSSVLRPCTVVDSVRFIPICIQSTFNTKTSITELSISNTVLSHLCRQSSDTVALKPIFYSAFPCMASWLTLAAIDGVNSILYTPSGSAYRSQHALRIHSKIPMTTSNPDMDSGSVEGEGEHKQSRIDTWNHVGRDMAALCILLNKNIY